MPEGAGNFLVLDVGAMARVAAERFHVWYEHLAPAHGYETRVESRKDWPDLDGQHRALMVDTVAKIVTEPGTLFCWLDDPAHSIACDRMADHAGPHSWEVQSPHPTR